MTVVGSIDYRFVSILKTPTSPALSITQALLGGDAGREPSAFVVRRMSLEFLKPSKIDDVLEVQTRVAEIGAASLTLNQSVLRDAKPVFSAEVLVVLISLSGKPQRLSQHIRAALES